MSSKVLRADNFPAPLMPVMMTNSCWSRRGAGRFGCGFVAGLLRAAREVARFFEGMIVGLSYGQRLSKIVLAGSYPDEVLDFGSCLLRCISAAMSPDWLLTPGNRLLVFRLGHQAVVQRKQRQLQPVSYAQLIKDVRQVPLDRLFADAEGLGDVLIGASLGDQVYHFQFARRQPEGLARRTRAF